MLFDLTVIPMNEQKIPLRELIEECGPTSNKQLSENSSMFIQLHSVLHRFTQIYTVFH